MRHRGLSKYDELQIAYTSASIPVPPSDAPPIFENPDSIFEKSPDSSRGILRGPCDSAPGYSQFLKIAAYCRAKSAGSPD